MRLLLLTGILFFSANIYCAIKVVSVKGVVAYKAGNNWRPLRANQVIAEGTKVSTGANSFATIQLNDFNHRVSIKPLTMIKIYSKNTNTTANSNIALKRGKIRVNVPKNPNVKTVFKVSTPVATSSVRGTIEDIFYGPKKGMIVKVVEGTIEVDSLLGKKAIITNALLYNHLVGHPDNINVASDMVETSFTPTSPPEGETGSDTGMDDSDTGDEESSGTTGDDIQILESTAGKEIKVIIPLNWN